MNYILLEEGYYRLSPAVGVATDIEDFDEGYERGRRLERMDRAEEAARAYEEAVALYRGDYLLEDLYEDWTMVERERLSNTHVEMLDRVGCALHAEWAAGGRAWATGSGEGPLPR